MRCNGIKSHFYCDCDYLYYGLLDYDSIEQIGLWNEWTVKLIFSLYKEHDKFQFVEQTTHRSTHNGCCDFLFHRIINHLT